MEEKGLSKKKIIKLLEEMRYIAGRMPEGARVKRFFLANDGCGIVLESGIDEAARMFGKTAEQMKVPVGQGMQFWTFQAGKIGVYQIKEYRGKEA